MDSRGMDIENRDGVTRRIRELEDKVGSLIEMVAELHTELHTLKESYTDDADRTER
jgi:hypothetical protein